MHTGVEGAAPLSFLPTIEVGDEEGDEESASVCNGDGLMALQLKVEISESIAGDMSPK